MPRTKMSSKPRDNDDFEGKATILLSTFIQRCPRPDSNVKCSNEINSESSECKSSSYAHHPTVLMLVASGRLSTDSFVSLDLPLDAYVTPGRGKRVECCLPVVCAADEEDIEALVTSVVCQRYVWNISIPVVGISLSKSGTTAKIVIGWSEIDTSKTDASVRKFLDQVTSLY